MSVIKRKALRAIGMTPKNIRVYHFIQAYWEQYGCGPSYKEIAAIAGSHSAGNGQYHVDRLVRLGYVRIGKRKGRRYRTSGSIHVTDKTPEWYDLDGKP